MFDDDEFNEIMKGLKFGKSNPKAKQAPSTQTRQTLRVAKSKNQPSGDNTTDLSDWLDRVEKLRKTISNLEQQAKTQQSENGHLQKKVHSLEKKLQHSGRRDTLTEQKAVIAQQELHDSTERVKQLSKENTSLQDRLAELEQKYSSLQSEVVDLRNQLAKNKNIKIAKLFDERGLDNSVEYGQLIGKMLPTSQMISLLQHWYTDAPESLSQFLAQQVRLVWSEAPKQARIDSISIDVSAERCEVTGGVDILKAKRTCIDGFLVNGYKSGVIVLPDERYESVLRSLMHHHAVHVTIATRTLSHPTVEQMNQKAQLVLIWSPQGGVFPEWEQVAVQSFYSNGPTLGHFLLDIGKQLA